MEIQEKFKAIADEWVGKEDENRNRVVVVIAVDKDSNTIGGVVQGKASLAVDAFTHIIEDEDKKNSLGRVIRRAQTRAALRHFSGLLDKLLGHVDETSEEQKEEAEEQTETTAKEQGEEASHE